MQDPQIPSVVWFRDYYDTVMAQQPPAHVVHVIQYPGETVYVPAGWPHAVLNLEFSVAVTHNYATEYPSMERLWKAVTAAEPDMAVRLQRALSRHRPDLLLAANGTQQLQLPPVVDTTKIEKDGGASKTEEHCGTNVLDQGIPV